VVAYTVSGSSVLEYVLLSLNFTKSDSTIDGSLEREREGGREGERDKLCKTICHTQTHCLGTHTNREWDFEIE
jgi:hypothetical protein